MAPRRRKRVGLPSPSAFLDGSVLALGGWTVACHLVMFSGGRPPQLAVAGALLLTGLVAGVAVGAWRLGGVPALFVWLGARERPEPPMRRPATGDGSAAAPEDRGRLRWLLACVALGALAFPRPSAGFFAATTLVCATALWLDRAPPTARLTHVPMRWARAGLWAAAVAWAAVVVSAHRSDPDDAFYLGLASSITRFPGLPILSFDPVHAEGAAIQLQVYRVHSLEPLAGLLSWASGLPVIQFMHIGLGIFGAAFVVFANARLLRMWLPARWPWALAALFAIYLLDGGRNQAYANFAFVRLFQGKALYASGLVPLLMVYGFRFGQAPTARRFVLLAAAQVLSLGTTASALPSAPIVAGAAVLAPLPWRADALRASLRTLLWGGLSSTYLLLTGIYFYVEMHAGRAAARVVARAADTIGEEATYRGAPLLDVAYRKVLGRGHTEWPMLGLALCALFVVASPRARRQLAVVGLLFFGVLANPWLSGLLSGSLFGQATFWRIFWVLPIPLAAAAVVASVPAPRGHAALARAAGVLALAGALYWSGGVPVLVARNGVKWGEPGHHASPRDYAVAEALSALLPDGGRVAAERRVAIWVPGQPQPALPLFAKKSYLRVGKRELRERAQLSACMEIRPHRYCHRNFVASTLLRLKVAAVALTMRSAQREPVEWALRRTGFTHQQNHYGSSLWLSERAAATQVGGR